MSIHGPVFGTAHTVAEVMENARRRVDASVADAAKDQRIRDLEREVGERDQNLQLAQTVIRDLNSKSGSLEREVERLMNIVSHTTSDGAAKWDIDADRADAERFRWLVEGKTQHQREVWLRTPTPWNTADEVRAYVDADRAKEGGA